MKPSAEHRFAEYKTLHNYLKLWPKVSEEQAALFSKLNPYPVDKNVLFSN